MAKPRQMTIIGIAADILPGKFGGAESHLFEVCLRLAKKHRILLFVGPDTQIQPSFPKSVKVIPIYYPKIPNLYGLTYIIFGLPQIVFHLRHTPFNVIWAKQSYPQAQVGALTKMIFHKPLYITAQNPQLHLEELVITGKLLQPFRHLLSHFITPLISWSYSKADLIAAVSQYSATLARQYQAKTVIVIPNGINLATFNNFQIAKPSIFTIVTTSSLIPRNGIDTLIQALSMVTQFQWHLNIAGSGPQERVLKNQVRAYKLESHITFLGRVNNHQIPQLLAQSHLFIRPSRYEGFGISFIEAMASKIPVIATPVGGITDFIVHDQTGLLSEPDNPSSLAHQIVRIKANEKLRRKVINNAYNLVKSKYTWNNIAKEVEHQLNLLPS